MKIVCDDRIPFLRGVFEPCADVVYIPGGSICRRDVLDADALVVRTRTRCDRSLLEGSAVKVIATATIGCDHIDTEWLESAGILWSNAPGCNSSSVAQYVASVICLLAQRHFLDLTCMTLGVVGVGNVGRKVAEVGRSLGMRVLLNDPPRERTEGSCAFTPLDELLHCSDIVTLHVPLSRGGEYATRHLLDRFRLASMRPDAFLINSSRGEVVDNVALRSVLECSLIRGAVLDVWEGEPNIDSELAGMLELATPHIAGYSADGKAAGTGAAVRAVARALDLPLKEWSPSGVPAPVQKAVFGLGDPAGVQDALCRAVLHCYDVGRDSDALQADVTSFERLRGDYPVRREFPAFTVETAGDNSENSVTLRRSLMRLGFNLKI